MTTPAQQKAAKAARQARWRERKAAAEALGVTLAEAPKALLPAAPRSRADDTVLDVFGAAIARTDFDPFDRNHQGAAKVALSAQAIKDKREQKTKQENFWFGLGAALAGATLIEDGNTIEGTARDVTPSE